MSTTKKIAGAIRDASREKTSPFDTVATVKRVEGSTAWVHIPGGVDETPVKMTINCKAGDEVQVRVSGGRAWVVGNATAPPTDDKKADMAQSTANTAREEAKEAGNTADYYITTINEKEGISVHSKNDGSNHVNINSSGMTVYKSGTDVAHFGETVRIGKEEEDYLLLDSNGVGIYDNGYGVASFSAPVNTQGTIIKTVDMLIYDPSPSQLIVRLRVPSPLIIDQFNVFWQEDSTPISVSSSQDVRTFNVSDESTWFYYNYANNWLSIYANGNFGAVVATFTLSGNTTGLKSANYIGSFPDIDNNNIFTIGNGRDSSNRSNAITVDWDGSIRVNQLIGTYFCEARDGATFARISQPASGTIFYPFLDMKTYSGDWCISSYGDKMVFSWVDDTYYGNIAENKVAGIFGVGRRGGLYSGTANRKLFYTKSWNWSNYNIGAGASIDGTNDISVSGYTPMALLGFDLDGTGCTYVNIVACNLSPTNNTVTWQFRNTSTSAVTITKKVNVLYIASSALNDEEYPT